MSGGARPGAGRKPFGIERVKVTVRLPVADAEWLKRQGAPQGVTIERLILRARTTQRAGS